MLCGPLARPPLAGVERAVSGRVPTLLLLLLLLPPPPDGASGGGEPAGVRSPGVYKGLAGGTGPPPATPLPPTVSPGRTYTAAAAAYMSAVVRIRAVVRLPPAAPPLPLVPGPVPGLTPVAGTSRPPLRLHPLLLLAPPPPPPLRGPMAMLLVPVCVHGRVRGLDSTRAKLDSTRGPSPCHTTHTRHRAVQAAQQRSILHAPQLSTRRSHTAAARTQLAHPPLGPLHP